MLIEMPNKSAKSYCWAKVENSGMDKVKGKGRGVPTF